MILANTLYEFVKFIGNQSQTGRIIPDSFNLAWQSAEIEYLNDLMGEGKATKMESFGGGDAALDSTRILTKSTLLVNDKFGWVNLPPDYFRWGALSLITGLNKSKPVQLLSDDKWAGRSNSQLNPPAKYPIAKLEGNSILAKPEASRYSLSYIRTPVTPKWAFTIGSNGRPVYDAGASVNSELPGYLMNQIAYKICSMLGINISKAELIQYAEMQSQ